MIKILATCGYNKDEVNVIRKDYGKRNPAKVEKWEQDITTKCGKELGYELIQLFRKTVNSLYFKYHTEALQE